MIKWKNFDPRFDEVFGYIGDYKIQIYFDAEAVSRPYCWSIKQEGVEWPLVQRRSSCMTVAKVQAELALASILSKEISRLEKLRKTLIHK